MSIKKDRYTVIDVLRGISVICMIIYHAAWDLVNVHSVEIAWFTSAFGSAFQAYIRWSFIIISGFSLFLGKRKIKRGLTVLLSSLAVTGVTVFVTPQSAIKYGVLTFLGVAMLVGALFEKLTLKIHPLVGIAVSFLLFLFFFNAEIGTVGLFGYKLPLPNTLFANEFTAFLGFPYREFHSSDYVPLIPWIFLYFSGSFLFLIFKRYGLLRMLSGVSVKSLEWVGRNALPIYLIHQPLIYGVMFLIFRKQ